MKCPNCQIEYESAFCPNCGAGAQVKKKPTFKKWWFWLIIVVALVVIIAFIGGGEGGISLNTGEINVESSNVVENVAEYKINRVFTTAKIEALVDGYIAYEAEAGKEYIVIDAEVKNLTSQYIDASEIMTMSLTIDGVTYPAHNYIVTEDDVDAYGTIAALETAKVYFAVSVPIGTNTEKMTLTATCGEKVSSCEISVSTYEAKKVYISLNKEYTDNSTMSVTFEKSFFTNRLDPSRIDGAYSYYEAESGKKYLVTKMKVKNLKGSDLDIDDITGIKCIYDEKYTYSGFVCVEDSDGSDLDSYSSIDPLETRTVYYLIEVPQMVEEGPVELEIYLMGTTYYYQVK